MQVEHGYAGIRDVRKAPPKHDDTQQSFFLAETLKYLYLMFGSNAEVSLDEWVFNTEAHPLRIVKVTAPTDLTPVKAATNFEKAPNEVNKAPVDTATRVEQAPVVNDEAPVILDERTES